jgi:3',5'-cyclic AMP phosphodiesterase CpdA
MSDIHVGHEDLGHRFRTIVDRLIFEKGDKPKNYVIIITGDLVEDANDLARYGEIKTVFDKLGNAGFDKILAVPGNHDYGTGSHGDKRFVKEFMKAFYGKTVSYPKVDIIDRVAFIGLDSMAEELHWYDELWAQGELGKRQIKDLSKILRSAKVKACKKRVVYLHHHPFDAYPLHELKDSYELRKSLVGALNNDVSIDAILYGHNHAGKVHNGKWGIKRCYDAGSATLKVRSHWLAWMPWFKVKEATRVIDLEKEPVYDYELPLLT